VLKSVEYSKRMFADTVDTEGSFARKLTVTVLPVIGTELFVEI
jgi:hypothetical protein